MIRVDGLREINTALEQLTRELPQAAVKATDRLLFRIWEGEKAQLVGDLDRPRAFSLGAIRYKRPRLADPVGEVYVVDRFRAGQVAREQDHYLGVQIAGGPRLRLKKSERAMQAMRLMPPGSVWVPASGTRLDASGNIPGTTIKRMLAEFRTFGTRPQADRRFYLRGGARRPPLGVYHKVGRQWRPLLWFVSPRRYQRLFDFYGRADREAAFHFEEIYGREIEREMQRRGLA